MLFVSMKRGRRGPSRGAFSQIDLTHGRRRIHLSRRIAGPLWRMLRWLPNLLLVGFNWLLGDGRPKPRRKHTAFFDYRRH